MCLVVIPRHYQGAGEAASPARRFGTQISFFSTPSRGDHDYRVSPILPIWVMGKKKVIELGEPEAKRLRRVGERQTGGCVAGAGWRGDSRWRRRVGEFKGSGEGKDWVKEKGRKS